jgi:hypothetical protein
MIIIQLLVPGATASDYTAASDVYGVAMVLSELILLELPLEKQMKRLRNASHEQWLAVLNNDKINKPDIPAVVPDILRQVILSALNKDLYSRPSVELILDVIERCALLAPKDV